MGTNNIDLFFNRQYGFSQWKQYDPIFYRLHPKNELPEVPIFETPIFACKNAQKVGSEHFAGLAYEDGLLIVMNTETKERYHTEAHNNAIFDLAWRFDQMQLVTASGDHSSKLYDVGDGDFREVRLFCGHSRSVKTVSFRRDDSSVFATGSRDGNICLWDTRTDLNSFIGKPDTTIMNSHTGKEVNTPSKNKRKFSFSNNPGIKSVTGLCFQDANTLISCGAGDGLIKIWDLRKHYTVAKRDPLPKHVIPYTGKTAKNGFSNLIVDKAGVKLYVNCLDNNIYCYNVATYNVDPIMTYTGHQNSTFYIKSALSQQEDYLVSGSSDSYAYIWNLKYSKPIVRLSGHTAEVTCVSWCGRKNVPSVVTCSDDMSFKVWTVDANYGEDSRWGTAEVLPLPVVPKPSKKRLSPAYFNKIHSSPKRLIWQCRNCEKATISDPLCQNCIPPSTSTTTGHKRKANCDLWSDCKRAATDFGPRRLFAHLPVNFREADDAEPFQILDRLDDDHKNINMRSLNKALDCFKSSAAKEDQTTSPTVNLPNYVIDGVAPHLNYSPPKRRSQDWLTKMRIERNLRQEMLERTAGPSSPKSPRLESTPKSSKKTWSTPKSPLLRFFRVTNSSNKSEGCCSSKSHNCKFLNGRKGEFDLNC